MVSILNDAFYVDLFFKVCVHFTIMILHLTRGLQIYKPNISGVVGHNWCYISISGLVDDFVHN
jgi:hypothetical protein